MEREIKLTLEQAKSLYSEANEDVKKLLLTNFPELDSFGWEDLKGISGYYIGDFGDILKYSNESNDREFHYDNINVFKTKKEALSSLAMAQLSQLMAHERYNGEPLEEWCDWGDSNQNKWIILRNKNYVQIEPRTFSYCCLAFKTLDIARLFIEEQEPLIRQYFQLH